MVRKADETAVAMLRWMLMARALDEQAIGGGSDAASALRARFPRGREAVHVGAGLQARDGDWVLPGPGDLALWLVRGTPPGVLLARLMGKPAGGCRGYDGWAGSEDLVHGLVAAGAGLAETIPVAAGIALAGRMRGGGGAVLCFIEERAAGRGDFHEGLNFAAVRKLPVVCVCTSEAGPGEGVADRDSRHLKTKDPESSRVKQWGGESQSTKTGGGAPQGDETHVVKKSDGTAQGNETWFPETRDGESPDVDRLWIPAGDRRSVPAAAVAYGIPAFTVDGNDAAAVHAAAGEAAARTRSGDGPTLVVATLAGKVDPVEKHIESCLEAKALTPAQVESLRAEVAHEVDEAARWAEVQPGSAAQA